MRQTPRKYLSLYRRRHHLLLKDTAFLLQMDQGSLSRFEAGKTRSPKALLGYHILFDMSIGDMPIPELLDGGSKPLVTRCDILMQLLERKAKTKKNLLRIKGLRNIKRRLLNREQQL